MAIFFTSDTHFQHMNIIRFCSRPFADTREMDYALYDNWNAVVGHTDTVYHLGDVAFGSMERILPRLRGLMGKKYLIPGNHDSQKQLALLAEAFEILPPLVELSLAAKGKNHHVTLCHYPFEVWNGSHSGALHFHGHTHGGLPGHVQRLDVGVDSWGFAPVRLENALERLKTLSPYRLLVG